MMLRDDIPERREKQGDEVPLEQSQGTAGDRTTRGRWGSRLTRRRALYERRAGQLWGALEGNIASYISLHARHAVLGSAGIGTTARACGMQASDQDDQEVPRRTCSVCCERRAGPENISEVRHTGLSLLVGGRKTEEDP